MKYLIRTAFILLFTISCNKKNKINDLEIKINNSYFQSVDVDVKSPYLREVFFDSNYYKKSLNIVNYSIINNSKKTYFIFIDADCFSTQEKYLLTDNKTISNPSEKNDICFNIYNENEIAYGNYLWPFHHIKGMPTFEINNAKEIIRNYIRDEGDLLGEKYFKYIKNNTLIIHPNEKKYFSTLINLPVRSPFEKIFWYSKLNNDNNYFASITLINNEKEIKKLITKNMKQEIKENGYTIFDGVIQSNKVPVKMVRIPN